VKQFIDGLGDWDWVLVAISYFVAVTVGLWLKHTKGKAIGTLASAAIMGVLASAYMWIEGPTHWHDGFDNVVPFLFIGFMALIGAWPILGKWSDELWGSKSQIDQS
jgi:hypothetical protein